MASGKKTWVWVLVAVGAACFVCGAGAVAWGMLSTFTGEEGGGVATASAGREGQPGASGGFSFTLPQGFASSGQGRWKWTGKDRDADVGVEVIRLPAIDGLDAPEAKVAKLWNERIGADWDNVPPAPMVMRRFVANGAKAHFTSGVVTPKGGGIEVRASIYLVEADDRLEPLVFLQTYFEEVNLVGITIVNHMAAFSWNATHEQVEQVLAGVQGSPVGAPLVSDEDVVGVWQYGTGNSLQWVNTLTGSTSMTAVTYVVDYTFTDEHRFTYKFGGASGQVGAMDFQSEDDEGEWRVEHDQLILAGKKERKFLLVGCARTPQGKRSLFMMPHPRWALSPGAIAQNGELYVEK